MRRRSRSSVTKPSARRRTCTSGAMRNKALASIGLLALSGCALILEGTSQEVTFNSQPQGANVTVAGQTAVTPVKLQIPKGDCEVVFEKQGYEKKTVHLGTQPCLWF